MMQKPTSRLEPWAKARADALAAGREPQNWIVLSESECAWLRTVPDLPASLRTQLASLADWQQEPVITKKRRAG